METITFALGVIVGLMLFEWVYSLETMLDLKKRATLTQKIDRRVAKKIAKQRGTGAVIMPQTDEEEAREELIARNLADGKETKLEDL